MMVNGARVVPGRAVDRGRWPFTVPAVAHLLDEGLGFTAPITVLVGENGTGKSTIVEALAERAGLHGDGGQAGTRYSPDVHGDGPGPLGRVLDLDVTRAGGRALSGPRRTRRAFFLRAETAYGMTRRCSTR